MNYYSVICSRIFSFECEAETEEQAEEMARNMDWDDFPQELEVDIEEIDQ